MRVSPNLRKDHPGFFMVVLALSFTHLGMAVDACFSDRHGALIWSVINDLFPDFWVWAVIHGVIAFLLLVGVYGKGDDPRKPFQVFSFCRIGCLLSLLSFNALAVAFLFAAVEHNLSFYPALASASLSLSSLAALREPRTNPAGRNH